MIEPIMIVSVFGRGLWLAESLLSQGIPVRWIDLSTKLGARQAMDIEGPFPLFQTQSLLESQKASWGSSSVDQPFEARALDSGIVFLTKEGPLEMRAQPFLQIRMKALGLVPENLEYLKEDLKPGRKANLKAQFMRKDLSEVWLSQWAHRFCSLQDISPVESVREGEPLKLQNECWIRKELTQAKGQNASGFFSVSDSVYYRRLQSLKNNSLFTMYSDVEVEDISFSDRSTPSGLLLYKESSELITCSQLVWGLTSAETKYLSSRLSERVFASREKEPTRIWMRWEVQFDLPEGPDYFVLLEDYELPWSHSNMVVFSRRGGGAQFSAWMLVPAAQRFNRAYLEEETRNLLKALSRRFPFLEVQILQTPKEQTATTQELGPPLYCQYKEGVFQQSILPRWERFYQLGPESQVRHGANGSFAREAEVEKAILKVWHKEQELLRKREARMKDHD